MLPKSYTIGHSGNDTKFEEIQIGDTSVSGGKCISKILIVVTEEDFDPLQILITASANKENYSVEFFEKLWDESKKKHITQLKKFKKQRDQDSHDMNPQSKK